MKSWWEILCLPLAHQWTLAIAQGFVLSFTSAGAGSATSGRAVNGSVLFGDPQAVTSNFFLSVEELASLQGFGFALFVPESAADAERNPGESYLFGAAADPAGEKAIFTD